MRKKHCTLCGSSNVKKKGFTLKGQQRWFCKICKKSFVWINKLNKLNKEKIWFEKWMIEGYSVRQLVNQSLHKKTKLYEIINYWLKQIPFQYNDLTQYKYILFDGSFVYKRIGVLVIMDGVKRTVITGEYGLREFSPIDLKIFFQPLKDLGLYPKSITVDGNPHVINTIKELWPNTLIQRCLVHIQRQGCMWCRAKPKRTDAKHLRKLFTKLTYIKTHKEKEKFLSDL